MTVKMDYDAKGKFLKDKLEFVPEGTGLVEGKVVIITGATLGIGLAMAKLFAEHRARNRKSKCSVYERLRSRRYLLQCKCI